MMLIDEGASAAGATQDAWCYHSERRLYLFLRLMASPAVSPPMWLILIAYAMADARLMTVEEREWRFGRLCSPRLAASRRPPAHSYLKRFPKCACHMPAAPGR